MNAAPPSRSWVTIGLVVAAVGCAVFVVLWSCGLRFGLGRAEAERPVPAPREAGPDVARGPTMTFVLPGPRDGMATGHATTVAGGGVPAAPGREGVETNFLR